MAMNISSNYDNIICKVLIHSGSPAVYQLTPKKENFGTLKRMTLGEKDPNKTNRTILLVGETGTGKSTMINTLVNYTMGVKWEDDVWFQIVEDEKRSQTSDVIVYQIFGFEDQTLPYSLTIIDTPGYGDTRGIEQDDKVSERLLDLFRSDDGVHEINAVGLVLKASVNRLSDRLRYIFDSVVSLFGKDMGDNIVALITHSDGRTPKNALKALEAANIQYARNEKNQPVYFLFDNCQNEDRTEDTEDLQHSDEITTKGMSHLTNFLDITASQNLEMTVDVLNERNRLRASVKILKERVGFIELKQKEIKKNQELLQKYEEKIKRNKNFIEEFDEVYKDRETVNGKATCCTFCEENCHYPGCTVAPIPEWCEVMRCGRCTVCTGRCHVLHHVKENWRFVSKTRKVQMTNENMKKKYEKNKVESESTLSLLEILKTEMDALQKKKDQWLDKSFQHVVKLEQIALNVDSLSTLVHLDFLIEKMKEKGDTEKVQKLEEMKRRVDEDKGIVVALRFVFGTVTAAGKETVK